MQPGLPADLAGIQAGDIITKVDGTVVEQSSDLPRLVGVIKPGANATLEVFRNKATRNVTVKVIAFDDAKPAVSEEAESAAAAKSALGLKVSDLTDAEKAELHVKGGVKVDSADGAAARAGVREGDIILSVAGTDITSAKQFAATVSKLDKTKQVNMLVRRGDSARYLLVRPAK